MIKYAVAGAAVLLFAPSALAQGGLGGNRPGQGGWSNQQAWTPPSQRLYDNGSSCGPDRAEPVWGAGNALAGYACVPEGANGS